MPRTLVTLLIIFAAASCAPNEPGSPLATPGITVTGAVNGTVTAVGGTACNVVKGNGSSVMGGIGIRGTMDSVAYDVAVWPDEVRVDQRTGPADAVVPTRWWATQTGAPGITSFVKGRGATINADLIETTETGAPIPGGSNVRVSGQLVSC